jgi:hypothetical protein
MRIKKNGTLLATALAIATSLVALPVVANAQHRQHSGIQLHGARHFHGRHFGPVIGVPYDSAPNYYDRYDQYGFGYAPQYSDGYVDQYDHSFDAY